MLPPFKLGVGGPVAGGRQYVPWVHADDVVGANAVLPRHGGRRRPDQPDRARAGDQQGAVEGARTRARTTGARAGPGLAVKALYGEMAQIVTTGVRAAPKRLAQLGYEFRQPELEPALRAVTDRR